MERLLPDARRDQIAVGGEYPAAQRRRIGQRRLDLRDVQLLPVDRAQPPGLCDALGPVARTEQAMHVNPRHAHERQLDRLGRDETLRLQRQRLVARRVGERIEVGDVQLVRAARPVGIVLVRHSPAMRGGPCQQQSDFLRRQDIFHGPHADPIVRGGEVKIRRAGGRVLDRRGPRAKARRVLADEGMQHQRRQRELVHELRFVRAVAKVGDVLRVRHVRLGDDRHAWRDGVEQRPEQADHAVCLLQVDAGRAGFLPQVRDRVQADEARAVRDVGQQHVDDAQQHIGTAKVQVDLVVAEGRPDVHRLPAPVHGGQQRQCTRSHHARQVLGRVGHDEVVAVSRVARLERPEPVTLGGDVVDHGVEHQLKVRAEPLHVSPRAQHGIDGGVVDHRKAVVGRIREERQHMYCRDRPGHVAQQEVVQCLQRRLICRAQRVAIRDQHHVALGHAFGGIVVIKGGQTGTCSAERIERHRQPREGIRPARLAIQRGQVVKQWVI